MRWLQSCGPRGGSRETTRKHATNASIEKAMQEARDVKWEKTDALRGEESESPFVDTMQFNKTSFVNKLLFFYRASHTDYKYLYGGMEEVT